MNPKPLSYQSAGVDITAGNALVEAIKPIVKRTHRPGVVSGLGGFGGLFSLDLERYQHPILVSATDGVGTKLKLATTLKRHDTIGIDLVAMCVNDIIVQGAEPLFFLDYYATGHLNVDDAKDVIAGIAEGCQQAGAALIGGETAEMPGMYTGEDYDLAGFCVGIVERDRLILPEHVKSGDVLLGLASSGVHANGFSLVRKIIERDDISLDQPFEGTTTNGTLGDALMAPTRIYVKSLLKLLNHVPVHAMAHITGGGLLENLPRVLPDHLGAHLDKKSWPMPPLFSWLQTHGNIAEEEMFRTFNCGVGMVVCVPKENVDESIKHLTDAGEIVWPIGSVEERQPEQPAVIIE